MASILDFTMNYRSDDEQKSPEMFFSGPKSYKIKKIEQFRGTNNKKMFYLHFDSHFVSCSYEGEFRGHFGFFHSNLNVSNFYFCEHK